MSTNSDSKKDTFGMTEEEFCKMDEKMQFSRDSIFEDKALEQFVRNPTKRNLRYQIKLKTKFLMLLLIFGAIFFSSIINGLFRGGMEVFIAIPIAILSFWGILILLKSIADCNRT